MLERTLALHQPGASSSGRLRAFDVRNGTGFKGRACINAAIPPEDSDTPELIELVDFINYYGDGLRNEEAFTRYEAWVAHRQSVCSAEESAMQGEGRD